MSKIETKIRCDNCDFSTWVIGLGRHILICRRKVNFVGKWSEVRLGASCANFEPSETFKTNPQAPRPIPLTKGKFAIVDADDYYRLVKYKWHINDPASNTLYAARRLERKSLKMHRVIMAAPDHLVVDHIDHNGLNNCKSNLRLCTLAQNNRNCGSSKGASSRYKGVSWKKSTKKWDAMIRSNKKIYRLGTFKNEIDAARAYDKKAAQLHGEVAHLNFPPVASKP